MAKQVSQAQLQLICKKLLTQLHLPIPTNQPYLFRFASTGMVKKGLQDKTWGFWAKMRAKTSECEKK
jgi:hypothetical protein